jgi:glycosyltransferase involved in cell wall biosynthesis
MRIIFVNRFYAPDHSATSQMLTDLATALAADHEVHVVTSRQRYDDPRASLPAHEVIDSVSVDRVRTTSFGRTRLPGRALDYFSFYAQATLALMRLAKPGTVIVAKTDPPLISVPVGWVARRRGAQLVNWLQDVFPEVAAALGVRPARGPGGATLRWLRNHSLRRAAVSVVLGRLMRDRVVRLGVDRAEIVEIPNWADGTALRPLPSSGNLLRTEWGLDGKFVVGYSGNFGRVHEFETLLGAARTVRATPELVFLLIGDGAQLESVKAAAEGLGNLMFKPYQPRARLGQSLGAADVHIVSLKPELEGLVVPSKFYGVAAVGRPTIFIGDPEGEVGSIIREAECGLCVRQGDIEGLATAITTLHYDVQLRERMSANARTLFDQRFDKPIAIKAWRLLLDSVARDM